MDALGIKNQEILEALKIGLIGYLIMIVLSTGVSYWVIKRIRGRSTQIIIISSLLLIFNITFVITNFVIQQQIAKASDSVSSTVALITALMITIPAGIYLKNFHLSYSGLTTEIEHSDDEGFTESVFEERRHKRRQRERKGR